MTVAQGLYKVLSYKKQTGLGTAASGSGGQQLRRDTATFTKVKGTFQSSEIVSHQQYTGDSYGSSKTTGQLKGELSAKTYADLIGSLLRTSFTAGAAINGGGGSSLTIAGTGPTYTITRSSGSYLADGAKIGDVVQITTGTWTGVAKNINLLVVGLTATVMTVIVPNGKTLAAQGPISAAQMAVRGKKAVVPSTGQANDYYTFEEWFSDLSLSRTYTDTQVASCDVSVPANGNATVDFNFVGLGRTKGNAQVLTSPNAPTSNGILSGENAAIIINGSQTAVATSLSMKIDGQLAAGDAVIGSKTISDNVKGDLKVSGTFTVLKQDESNSNIFDAETSIQIIAAIFADATDSADFVSFSIPAVNVMSDDVDDGKKQLISTHNWTAEYNGLNGGATAVTDTGIISIQDASA